MFKSANAYLGHVLHPMSISWVPQVNFVGKLLGPQGNTIKRLQEDTGAKISVLGKGSMRDKNKVCGGLLASSLRTWLSF